MGDLPTDPSCVSVTTFRKDVVKIGELELTHQVVRQRLDRGRGYPGGPDVWYWCTRCGDVLASQPADEVRSCECGNPRFDVGRLSVDDHDELVLLATSSRPGTI